MQTLLDSLPDVRATICIALFVYLYGLGMIWCLKPRKILVSGVVINKQHEPASSRTIAQPFVVGNIPFLPIRLRSDEGWTLTIEGYIDGEKKTRTLSVPKETYETLWVGDTYTLPL